MLPWSRYAYIQVWHDALPIDIRYSSRRRSSAEPARPSSACRGKLAECIECSRARNGLKNKARLFLPPDHEVSRILAAFRAMQTFQAVPVRIKRIYDKMWITLKTFNFFCKVGRRIISSSRQLKHSKGLFTRYERSALVCQKLGAEKFLDLMWNSRMHNVPK